MDIGDHHFTLTLTPHGAPLAQHELFALADRHQQGTLDLVGGMTDRRVTALLPRFAISAPFLRLSAAKRAEEDEDIILRLNETDGEAVSATLTLGEAV